MKKKVINSSRVAVYRDAGFELFDATTTADAFKKEAGCERDPDLYIYSRYRNPTVVAAEDEIMKIEGSSWALLTQSGMAAVDIAVSIFQNENHKRPWLFFSEIYGGTISYAETILRRHRGLDIHYFYPDNGKYNLTGFENKLSELKPEFVYFEAISNPLLIVPDAVAIINIAQRHGVKVIVDNTFATPVLWKPLESKADIVLHSATKYFGGHGNITAGVLCGNDPDILKAAIEYRKYVGHMLSPDDAYRLQTQLLTFNLRFSQQCKNANMLSELLSKEEKIGKVFYPGLQSHSSYEEAQKLFNGKGFGGMLTFDFAGFTPEQKRIRRDDFIKAISSRVKLIPTLGDPHTILMPVEAVWGTKYPEPGMIRLSAGFEDSGMLFETFMSALNLII